MGKAPVRIYYGWFIVGISMLVLMLAIGATISAFGLFILPVSEAFDLSRAEINTGIILLNLGMAIAAPFLGRMLDLFPARRVMAVSAILLGGSLAALGLSQSVWLSAAVLAVPLSLGIAGVGTLTSMVVVARWFVENRGRALAVTAVGTSLGGVLVVPVVGLLISAMGWQQTLVLLGCGLAIIFLGLVPLVREKPAAREDTKTSGGVEKLLPTAKPIGTARLLQMPQFWTISLSTAATFGALQTTAVTLVPLAQESGLSVVQSASLLSVVGAMSIVGKLVFAWIGDRLDRTALLVGLFVFVALTSAALFFGNSYATLIAGSAFLGLVSGAIFPAFLALLADRFGAASFGTVNGAATFIIAVVSAGCIRYGGEVYDATGNYDLMFLSFIATGLLAAIIMFSTGAFRQVTSD